MAGNVQEVPMRNYMPVMPGSTLGQRSSASTPYGQTGQTPQNKPSDTGGSAPVDDITKRALAVSLAGQPLPFWLMFIGLLIGLGFLAKKLPGVDASEFKTIKVSFMNVVVISIAAMIGITFFKIVFTKWPVPGLSAFVLAV